MSVPAEREKVRVMTIHSQPLSRRLLSATQAPVLAVECMRTIFDPSRLWKPKHLEPSFDGSGSTMRQGTQSGGVVVDLMERLRARQQEKA